MVVAVAGCWELGWSAPISEVDLWRFPLKDFAVDKFYMTPVSGIRSRDLNERETMPDIFEENPDLTVVFVEEGGTTNLSEFDHPKDCLYVFGKAGFSPWRSLGDSDSISLKVETNRDGEGRLWPHQAAAIVLYDRLLKG